MRQQQVLSSLRQKLTAGDLLRSLPSIVDNVGTARLAVDMIKFAGPAFKAVDNRLVSLYLIQRGLTNAVMFAG